MLINKTYFKKYSPIPTNYNLDEVMLYLPVATKIWIKPLIGDALFDELEYQIDNDALSEENSTLLVDGGLWQYLCFATIYEALPFIWSHMADAVITVADTEHSKSITLKDLTYIEQHLRRQIEVLKAQTLKWLCERQDVYPLFDTCQCDCGGCCGDSDGLKKPNANWEIFSTGRKRTDLR